MKKTFIKIFILSAFFSLAVLRAGAQSGQSDYQIVALAELDVLRSGVDKIDAELVLPLQNTFDNCKTGQLSADSFVILVRKIRTKDSALILAVKQIANTSGGSEVYRYVNRELTDYGNAVNVYIKQAERLVVRFTSATEIGIFTNAWLNVNLSRSLLYAAMGNLERYYSLGYKVKNIQEVDSFIKTTTDITKQNTDSIGDTTGMVYTTAIHTDTLLNEEFKPYTPLSKKNTNLVSKAAPDKITMAANTLLIDNRRNWWWRTLIGGVVGGLIAGLIVVAIK